jgi:hypothetical protein
VSLSWRNPLRDHYTVVIGPEKVTLLRRRCGLRGEFDLKLDVPFPSGIGGTGIRAALEQLLGRPEVAGGDLTVLLSNAYVRFQLVPWDDGVSSPEEMRAFARVRFEQVYGPDAVGWALETAPEGADRPRIAFAVEQDLLAQVRAAVAASKLRLRSLQPYLVAAYNRLRPQLRDSDFAFVVAEATRICLLVATGGLWSAVRAHNGSDAPAQLGDVIDRELQLMGFGEGRCPPVFVHAPQQAHLRLRPVAGVNPQTLSIPLPASLAAAADQSLAMAMTVA